MANHHGQVVVVTSAEMPRNNGEGFVLICCFCVAGLFAFLFHGKIDNQVQMFLVKAFAANYECVHVCQLQLVTRKLSALREVDEFPVFP